MSEAGQSAPGGEDAELDRIYAQARRRLEEGDPDPFPDLARRNPALAPAIDDLAMVHRAVAGSWSAWPDTLVNGKYRVVACLGRGGQAMVYRAVDTVLDREVAIKLLSRQLLSSGVEVERMLREARALAALDHPHIVRIHDAAQEDDAVVVVLELVRGRDLARWVAESGRPPLPFALEVVRQVASALAFVHEAGMIHRDVKPANILVDAAGPAVAPAAKLADFGLVSWPRAGTDAGAGGFAGTCLYAAPEHRRELDGEPADIGPWTDVYSLGCVLRELLTGSPDGSRPLPAGLDSRLVRALDGMLATDRRRRWSAAEAALELGAVLQRHDRADTWVVRMQPAAQVCGPARPLDTEVSAPAAVPWGEVEPRDRAALERLSVFHGPFSLGAAESMLAALEGDFLPRDVLARLIGRGLTARVDGGASLLALPDALRGAALQSARDRGTLDHARRLHLARGARRAPAWRRELTDTGPGAICGERAWELADLEAALGFALGGGEFEAALELAVDLAPIFAAAGRAREGQAWMVRCRRRGRVPAPAVLLERARLASAFLAISAGRWRSARRQCSRVLRGLPRPFDAHQLVAWLINFSIASRHVPAGQDLAMASCRSALELLDLAPHRGLESAALESLAQAHVDRGELAEAARALERAAGASGERRGGEDRARRLLHRARVSLLRGDLDLARLEAQEAHEVATGCRHGGLAAAAANHLGAIAIDRGALDEAAICFAGALGEFDAAGDRRGAATVWTNLAGLHAMAGDVPRARDAVGRARSLLAGLGAPVSTSLRVAAARLAMAEGRWEDAGEELQAAGAAAARVNDRPGLLGVVECASELAFARGAAAPGCRLAGAADAARDAMGARRDRAGQARLEAWLDRAREALGPAAVEAAVAAGRSCPLEGQPGGTQPRAQV